MMQTKRLQTNCVGNQILSVVFTVILGEFSALFTVILGRFPVIFTVILGDFYKMYYLCRKLINNKYIAI